MNLQVAQLFVDECGCVHALAAYGTDQGISEKSTDRPSRQVPVRDGWMKLIKKSELKAA
ncbi:hypothetical protein [Sulfuricystis multivorans]|uniref:hypothetical protein n=1 Tax=Sulfuricystis multivorans TaxID=2211108 RepID=UPI001558DA8D|nr:hypothetical protein [Sulfuricystis multivorans]